MPYRVRVCVGTYEGGLHGLEATLPDKPESKATPLTHFFGVAGHIGSVKSLGASYPWLLSGATDETLRIYNYKDMREHGTLFRHNGAISGIQFYRDKYAFTSAKDGKIIVWSTLRWEAMCVLSDHEGAVNSLDIHPTGRLALSVGIDSTLRLWNLMNGKLADTVRLNQIGQYVQWSPSGLKFAVLFERKVHVYNVDATLLAEITSDSILLSLSFLDEEYIVVGGEAKSLQVFQIKDGTRVHVLPGHPARVRALTLVVGEHSSNDSGKNKSFLTSASTDGTVLVWSLPFKSKTDRNRPVGVAQTNARLNVITAMNPKEMNTTTVDIAEIMSHVDTSKLELRSVDLSERGAPRLKTNKKRKRDQKRMEKKRKNEKKQEQQQQANSSGEEDGNVGDFGGLHGKKKNATQKMINASSRQKDPNPKPTKKPKVAFKIAKLQEDDGVEPAKPRPKIAMVDRKSLRKKKKNRSAGKKKTQEREEQSLEMLQLRHGMEGGDATEYIKKLDEEDRIKKYGGGYSGKM